MIVRFGAADTSRWHFPESTSPGGEIGRRKGLKILFRASGVRVQVPPRAPSESDYLVSGECIPRSLHGSVAAKNQNRSNRVNSCSACSTVSGLGTTQFAHAAYESSTPFWPGRAIITTGIERVRPLCFSRSNARRQRFPCRSRSSRMTLGRGASPSQSRFKADWQSSAMLTETATEERIHFKAKRRTRRSSGLSSMIRSEKSRAAAGPVAIVRTLIGSELATGLSRVAGSSCKEVDPMLILIEGSGRSGETESGKDRRLQAVENRRLSACQRSVFNARRSSVRSINCCQTAEGSAAKTVSASAGRTRQTFKSISCCSWPGPQPVYPR